MANGASTYEQQQHRNRLERGKNAARRGGARNNNQQSSPSPSLEGGLGAPVQPRARSGSAQQRGLESGAQGQGREGAQQGVRSAIEGAKNRARKTLFDTRGSSEKLQDTREEAQGPGVDMRSFFYRSMSFAILGLIYDITMAALDWFVGVGSVVSLVGNFCMWGIYWVLVWRQIPQSLRGHGMLEFGKARKRFALNYIIEAIPIVGQIWVGWFGLGIDAYLMVKKDHAAKQMTKALNEKKSEKGASNAQRKKYNARLKA